ncbi:HD domain-containing protein [Mycena sanguinolenta]|uniref:HD domain-containing protein n=1 Tax=Mycena sanguinolenta TaxID=230812 RepID=A0A8H6U129_9AGAR|nr:HD domain-containing protein [Mycena sanguinolenta]
MPVSTMVDQKPYQSQQPMPTVGMQIGGGGNRNALWEASQQRRETRLELRSLRMLRGVRHFIAQVCYACWCPCIVHGKNKQRLEHLNNNGTPAAEGGSACSGACWAFCCLHMFTGAGCILECMNRGEVRGRYGIEGGACGDFMAAWCCLTCDLTQVSREIELEEKSFGQNY